MKHRVKLLAVFVLILLLGLAAYFVLRSTDAVTPEACARIRPGMDLSEAEAVLGPAEPAFDMGDGGRSHSWHGSRGHVVAAVDREGRVIGTAFVERTTWLDTARSWWELW